MKAYSLEGSSMQPVFKAGGAALVLESRPGPGDCAVYSWEGRTLLHRVLAVSPEGAWLADDAGRLAPHFVPWADVKGRALGGPLSGGFPGLLYSRCRRAFSRSFIHA